MNRPFDYGPQKTRASAHPQGPKQLGCLYI
jgi:hypothetical protein